LKVNIKGVDVNYEVAGEGDYVFLFHGWGADLSVFKALAALMAGKYRVVSFDFPGFGLTAEPPEVWSVSDYSDLAAELIKHFECDKVILLGHSFGGRVIIKMCAIPELPFSIDKIILVGSAGVTPKRSLNYKIRLRTYKLGKAFLSAAPVKRAAPGALDRLKARFGSADYNNASEIMKGVLVKTVNEDLRGLLGCIKCPALLIWGESDAQTPVSDGRLMEKLIPGSALIVMEGAGHYPFLERQYAFNEIMKSFLCI
jgi:pimeloyl-ACP methyl ester carboxylesterase